MFVEVDGDAPPSPQALEEDETIEVVEVPLDGRLEERLRGFEAEGYGVWVGLHSIAQGMRMGAMYGGGGDGGGGVC